MSDSEFDEYAQQIIKKLLLKCASDLKKGNDVEMEDKDLNFTLFAQVDS